MSRKGEPLQAAFGHFHSVLARCNSFPIYLILGGVDLYSSDAPVHVEFRGVEVSLGV